MSSPDVVYHRERERVCVIYCRVCEIIFSHCLLCTQRQHMHLCGGECVLLITYLVKVFLLQKRFLPRKQTTNYHNSLTRGRENPFAVDSDN